jgi:hypothetical protein
MWFLCWKKHLCSQPSHSLHLVPIKIGNHWELDIKRQIWTTKWHSNTRACRSGSPLIGDNGSVSGSILEIWILIWIQVFKSTLIWRKRSMTTTSKKLWKTCFGGGGLFHKNNTSFNCWKNKLKVIQKTQCSKLWRIESATRTNPHNAVDHTFIVYDNLTMEK